VFEEKKLHITVNNDSSGSLKYSKWDGSAFWVTYKAQWDATGHGQYREFEDGIQINEGSWQTSFKWLYIFGMK